jgi:F0F1-type ATP synthase delta subunit
MSSHFIDPIIITEAYNVCKQAQEKMDQVHVYTQAPHTTQQQLNEISELLQRVNSMLYGYKI